MTGDQRLMADLSTWMVEDAETLGDPVYLDAVFASTRTIRQRSSWSFPARWLPWVPTAPSARPVARLVLTGLLALALLAALVVGWAGSRALLFGDAVIGSGWRLLDAVPTAQWTLEARLDPWTGIVSGRYTFERDGGVFDGEVTCMRVAGSRAVVGGRITSGNVSDIGFLVWFDDGGASAGGPPGTDALTFTPTAPSDPTWPTEIPDIPTTCPSIEPSPGIEWRQNDGEIYVIDR